MSGVGVEEGVVTVELVGVGSVELVGVDSVVGGSVELVGSVELDVGVMGFGVVVSVIDIFTATKSMEDFSGTASFSVA